MFIDSLAPDNSISNEHKRLIKLWQNVVIAAFREACASPQAAYSAYNWSRGSNCKEVCQMANLSHDLVSGCFYKMQDDEYRQQIREKTFQFKSNTTGFNKENKAIQQELFYETF